MAGNQWYAESVFSSPFYLQNLLDFERFPNYPINDPLGFLNSLMLVNLNLSFSVH
jgi:DnaJ family protein C protein 13